MSWQKRPSCCHCSWRDVSEPTDTRRDCKESSRLIQRLLPDRHDSFHLTNQPLARREGFAGMWGDDFHPQRRFVDFHHADAMHKPDGFDGPTLFDLIEKQVELVCDHLLE